MPGFFDDMPAHDASALTGFAGNRIARWSEHRAPDAIAKALAEPAARTAAQPSAAMARARVLNATARTAA